MRRRILELLEAAFDRAVELVGLDVDEAWCEFRRRMPPPSRDRCAHRGNQGDERT